MANVNPDSLTEQITESLAEYTDEIAKKIDDSVTECGNELLTNIKRDSPKETGDYKRGWRLKVTSANTGNKSVMVYNATKGFLTHLLENGHAKRGGGRVEAKPHIRKNEVEIVSKFEKSVEEIIKNG